MALIDNTTTYTGKEADGFYSLALLTGDSKSKIRQIPGVKDKIKINSLELGSFLQADSCTVAESGDHTIDDVTLTVCDIAFNIPLCYKDYETMYLSEMMKPGANTEENFPNGLVDYIFGQVADHISKETEEIMWTGDTAGSPASLCDGFIKLLAADPTVVQLASPLTLSASNIVTELTRVVNAIPNTVKNKGKGTVKIFLSISAAHFYEQALVAASPALYAYNNANLTLSFMGYELVIAPGMPADTMVVTDPMNLCYGTDLASDEKQIELMKNPNPGQQKQANVVGSFKIGFQFIKGAEIVLYGA